ncbi:MULTISPECIES: type IV conjugative transfer system protein TraL [Yersinia pseudotuberculosis complex]|uniref:type IV conjugative transfer system protein TraL n=1 Tax=Yersinia pseudotuberculosis complex TaxID=1649845 RepID=UPI0004201E9A|nr:type IV conjugative transfer system protein TraL [Yersinia wautersii]BET65019.1 type IV conjugative transfer system protein TraL [Yersinia pseudotuberculosis]
MNEDKQSRYQFPQTFSEQRRIIGIPLDEAIAAMTPLCWGVIYNHHFAGLIIGAVLWFALNWFKKGRGSTWLYNMCYWYLPSYLFKGLYKILPDSSYRLWLK